MTDERGLKNESLHSPSFSLVEIAQSQSEPVLHVTINPNLPDKESGGIQLDFSFESDDVAEEAKTLLALTLGNSGQITYEEAMITSETAANLTTQIYLALEGSSLPATFTINIRDGSVAIQLRDENGIPVVILGQEDALNLPDAIDEYLGYNPITQANMRLFMWTYYNMLQSISEEGQIGTVAKRISPTVGWSEIVDLKKQIHIRTDTPLFPGQDEIAGFKPSNENHRLLYTEAVVNHFLLVPIEDIEYEIKDLSMGDPQHVFVNLLRDIHMYIDRHNRKEPNYELDLIQQLLSKRHTIERQRSL